MKLSVAKDRPICSVKFTRPTQFFQECLQFLKEIIFLSQRPVWKPYHLVIFQKFLSDDVCHLIPKLLYANILHLIITKLHYVTLLITRSKKFFSVMQKVNNHLRNFNVLIFYNFWLEEKNKLFFLTKSVPCWIIGGMG